MKKSQYIFKETSIYSKSIIEIHNNKQKVAIESLSNNIKNIDNIIKIIYNNENYKDNLEVKKIIHKYLRGVLKNDNIVYKDIFKYQCSIKDVMMKTLEAKYDIIINTSCEHMYPMTKFYEWNPELQDPIYVLQSTDDDQYDDHINCVGSPQELADQAKIAHVLYADTLRLSNGMNRFMVIGYPS